MKLWLDDIRPAPDRSWLVVRSYDEAIELISDNGGVEFISFDHDLGAGQPTGMDVAKWLVDMDLWCHSRFLPRHFKFYVHSSNPCGADNIRGLLNCYLEKRLASSTP